MHGLVNDLRFGFRRLLLAPAFTTLVAATLALSIGATTATYSVVDGLMFRPLPYPDPSRLVDLSVLTEDGISRRNGHLRSPPAMARADAGVRCGRRSCAFGTLLVEIKPTDALTYMLVIASLVLAAFAACWIPARRATSGSCCRAAY